ESLESTQERIAGSGEAMEDSKDEEASLTTKFNNIPKALVKDLVLSQRFVMSHNTILVSQAAHFMVLMMKFKTSPVMRKNKADQCKADKEVVEKQTRDEQPV
nr:hypothetical protein [Tanacetum cinerariifolium]GEZ88394.1 hypothetical protein [Tanacetum cinerariifolium]